MRLRHPDGRRGNGAVYETSSAEQVRWVLSDSGAVAVFAENAQRAAVVRQAQVAAVEAVWILEAGALDRLARSGAQVSADEVLKRRRAMTPATPATIAYTSGTTGRPKGCVLSHGNLTAAVRAVTGAPGISEHVLAPGSSVLLFLPLSHILARVVALCVIHAGRRIGYLADLGMLPAALPAFRPTILLAVPRVFEKLADAAGERPRPAATAGCSPRPRPPPSPGAGPGAARARWYGCGTRCSAA